jgi:hypothetical protein
MVGICGYKGESMRKLVALTVLAFGFAITSGATAATALTGQFTVHFGRGVGTSNAPCAPDTFCGAGTLVGFGQATDTVEFTSFEPIEGTACFETTFIETVELANGTGTLVLASEGTFCTPGASGDAPTSPQGYGHPATLTATFTVDGASSTGIFAGASGSGTKSGRFAGDVAAIKLAGAVTLSD